MLYYAVGGGKLIAGERTPITLTEITHPPNIIKSLIPFISRELGKL